MVGIPPALMDAVFPFHFAYDAAGVLVQLGAGLRKACPKLVPGEAAGEAFAVASPPHGRLDGDAGRVDELFVLHCRRGSLDLKGQCVRVDGDGVWTVFLGSPVVRSVTEVAALGLNLRDFPLHDSVIDHLILLQAKDATISQSRQLAERLRGEVDFRRRTEEALRKSEAMLRRAQQVARLGNWEWNTTDGTLAWSEELYRIGGLAADAPPDWGRFDSIVHPEDREAVRAAHVRTLRGDPPPQLWFRVVHAGGEVRHLAAQSEVRREPRSGATIVVGIVQDVTEATHRERQLRARTIELEALKANLEQSVIARTRELADANRELEELNAQKSRFVSVVSHELRSPLTSIKSFTELLLDDIETGDADAATQSQYLRIVDRETDRLARLINDLLDLQRIDAGRMVWRDEPIDLADTLHSAVEFYQLPFAQRGVRLEIDAPAGGYRMLGDADRLKQVVLNLIANALNYTPRGGTVSVSLGRVPVRGAVLPAVPGEVASAVLTPALAGEGIDLLHSCRCPRWEVDCPLRAAVCAQAADGALLFLPDSDADEVQAVLARLTAALPLRLFGVGPEFAPAADGPDGHPGGPVDPRLCGGPPACIAEVTDEVRRRRASQGERYSVTVADTGVGIAAEETWRIFDRFYQVSRDQRSKAGTGLGLSIAREIIEHYQGSIWVESRPGAGATFRFVVPQRPYEPKRIGAILVDAGVISEEQLHGALTAQRTPAPRAG
jgi:PAS domain S-box-containing protein